MATKKDEGSKIQVFCAHTEMKLIGEVNPHPGNPNTHPQNQIRLLAKIIQANGWRNPIVISKRSGYITKGHARLAAAKLLRMNAVPVDFQHYESEAQEWEDMLADNQIAELAEMDDSLLKEALRNIKSLGGDLDLTGYSSDEIAELLETTPDVIEDVLKDPKTKVQWDAFKVFHVAIGEQIYCMDKFNYLISYGTQGGSVPKRLKPPNSTVFVDSGMLTLAGKLGRKATEKQPEAIKYAEAVGADWLAMMDIPLVAPVLDALKLDKKDAYKIHLENAQAFFEAKMNPRKVYVMQGVTLGDYQRCCRDMAKWIKPTDVIAVGSIKARANAAELIQAVVASVNKAFPQNDIHLFGVTNTRSVSKAIQYGATSADSSVAGCAVGRGEVYFCKKQEDEGFGLRKQTMMEIVGQPDLSCSQKLWTAMMAFNMAQVELAVMLDAGLASKTKEAKRELNQETEDE